MLSNQIIANPENKNEIIKEIYLEYGLGAGIKTLYELVSRKYLNISRKDIESILKSQSNYQIAQKKPKQINRKHFATDINKIWNMDLIDLSNYKSKNSQYRYVMTIVDTFSKYVFLEKLKNKTDEAVKSALSNICCFKARAFSRVLISDNGREFRNNIMEAFCQSHNIKQVFSPTYTPVGLVEATNGLIRQVLRAVSLHNGNLNWINHLDDIEKSINERSSSSSTGRPRREIYEGSYLNEVREKGEKERKKAIDEYKHQKFNIGDIVRVYNSSLSSYLRSLNKAGNQKLIVAIYSLELYRVVRKTNPKNPFLKETYKILNIATGNVLRKSFYYNELVLVPPGTQENPNLTPQKINTLNSFKRTTPLEGNIVETRARRRNREIIN